MKKTILYKLSLIVLAALLINGCGKKTDDVESANEVISSDIEEADEDVNEHIEQIQNDQIENKIPDDKNILEDVESATVSDGTYSITLGMHLEDLEYDEEELPWDETVGDNRFTTLKVEGITHDIMFHIYNDFTLYTSDFNHLNGDFIGYYVYIHSIELKTDRFQTSDGFRVGMSEKELKDFYRDELGEKYMNSDEGYYYMIKATDNVSIFFDIDLNGTIEMITVNTDFLKYY